MKRMAFCWLALACCLAAGPARAENRIFAPSPATVRTWVGQGIDGAAADLPLARLRVLNRTAWAGALDIAPRRLRMAVALTPEAVATLAGWEAAWDEETWERIKADRATVTEEIAQAVMSGCQKRELTLALVFDRLPSAGRGGPVGLHIFAGGRWYYGTGGEPAAIEDFADWSRPNPPGPEWAARCLASLQLEADPQFKGAEIILATIRQDSRPGTGPPPPFHAMVDFLQPGEWYLAAGGASGYGGFTMAPE